MTEPAKKLFLDGELVNRCHACLALVLDKDWALHDDWHDQIEAHLGRVVARGRECTGTRGCPVHGENC